MYIQRLLACLVVFLLAVNTATAQTLSDQDHPLLRGLIAWWIGIPGFTGGDKIYDAVGRNQLTLTNMGYTTTSGWSPSLLQPGRMQLNCDGTNDVALGTTPDSITDLNQKTILAWINITGYGGGGYGRIIDKRVAGGGGGWAFLVNNTDFATGFSFVQGFSTASGDWGLASVLSTGVWFHVGVKYDKTNVANVPTFFLNGEPRALTNTTSSPSGTGSSDSSSAARICDNDAGTRSFAGSIADVQIFNRLLSDPEVRSIYQAGRADQDTRFVSQLFLLGMTAVAPDLGIPLRLKKVFE